MSLKKYIPNTITALNLACGVLGVVFALDGRIELAFALMLAAALFDFCDGLAARVLGAYSDMGKELDSLCDCVSFGLAPGLIMYAMMQASSPDSWLCYSALLIPILGAVRLAKFNVDTRQATSFIGMPIPANAIFWIGFASWYANNLNTPLWVVIPLIVVVSLLMVSNIPMFSLKVKNLNFKQNYKVYFLVLAFFLFIFTSGLPGMAWTIIFYVLASIVDKD